MLPLLARLRHNLATPDLKDVFRTIEWLSIAIFGLVLWLAPTYKEWTDRFPLSGWSGYGVLGALFCLSWVFPVKRPLWQRRLYVGISAGLLITSLVSGDSFDILLYLLIAKSCFLLSRRDLVVMLVGVGIVWNLAQTWLYQASIALMNSQSYQEILNSQRLFISMVVSSSGVYIMACTFVLLLSFTILREQRSRTRAEQLTQEVEILAATVERSRIAREIHDSLGHTLTALNVQIELAQKLHQRDPAQAGKSIEIAQTLATQCLQDVRQAVHSMRDRTIDLNLAVHTLVQPMQTHGTLQFNLCLNFPALPPTFSHQIYCIIKEGLTNIQRHAQATQVQLKGELWQDQIVVILRDNGSGFEFDQATAGFGLRSMTERAQNLGGRLQVESGPDRGTLIRLEAPAPLST
jgi:signal transduction histidine kinase